LGGGGGGDGGVWGRALGMEGVELGPSKGKNNKA